VTGYSDEPAFLDDEGPSADLPPFPTTTNIRELYGWQPGETLTDAIARHQAEQAGKARPLNAAERAGLRQDMAEASEWMRAEMTHRRTTEVEVSDEAAAHVPFPPDGD